MWQYTSDEDLLSAMAAGNEEAFRYLFEKYSARLYGFAMTFTSDATASEDIIQECFMKIWLHRRMFKNVSLKALLFSIVRNACLNFLRHRSFLKIDPLEGMQATDGLEAVYCIDLYGDAEHRLLADELKEQIEQAIERLPERTRNIYRMSRDNGLKNRDIAKQTGLSMTTVEKHMNKAVAELAAYFSKRYPIDVYTIVVLILICG